jgi:hypothetical protein
LPSLSVANLKHIKFRKVQYNYKPDEVPDPGDKQYEDLGQVLVVRNVRQNAAVAARLQELAAGADPWQAAAARLALHSEDLRLGR